MSPGDAFETSAGRGEHARHATAWPSWLGRLVVLGLIVVAAYAIGYHRNRPRVGATPTEQSAEAGFVGFDPAEIDLGEQPWGQVVPLELPFVNLGKSPVVIESLDTSCDCTVVAEGHYEGRQVDPGETFVLKAALHTGKNPGLKNERVQLGASTGDRWSVSIKVNVHGTWRITPEIIDFNDVVLGEGPEWVERLAVFRSDSDQLVGAPECTVPWLECVAARTQAGTAEILVRVAKQRLAPGRK